jgi:hypothetical protein
MDKIEIEDLKSYRTKSKRKELFSTLHNKFGHEINMSKQHFNRFMTDDEIDANAVLAIDDVYAEVEERMFEFALKKINIRRLFAKHIQRQCRKLKVDNEPLSKSIGKGFRKEHMGRAWDGYLATFCTFGEELAVDELFVSSFESNIDYLEMLPKLTEPEQNEDVYFDLLDRYVCHMSFVEISMETRNSGRSTTSISQRLIRYVEKLKKRANLLKIEGQ